MPSLSRRRVPQSAAAIPADPAACRAFADAASARFAACRGPLRAWFAANARPLPWRRALPPDAVAPGGLTTAGIPLRSPYAVWVSEIMLQQTVVSAVVGHFERWMATFPDVKVLAAAPPETVLRAWAGLGYYARARNLHAAARALVAAGAWPDDAAGWKRLPGVGDYTAGAVASLAFGARAPIIDGNVVRVFSRVLGIGFLPGDGAAARAAWWDLARRWADATDPGTLNEAVMELGALVCVPATPRCGECPLAQSCVARAEGRIGELPVRKVRPAVEAVPAVAVSAFVEDAVLTVVRPPGGFLAGHPMFPLFTGEDASGWRAAFRREFPEWTLGEVGFAGRLRHTIMSRRYEVEVWRATLAAAKPRGKKTAGTREAVWVAAARLDETLTSSLAGKIWKVAGVARVQAS